MDAIPVDTLIDLGFRKTVHAFQCPFFVFGKSNPVDDIADVFFSAGGFGVNVLFYESVCI